MQPPSEFALRPVPRLRARGGRLGRDGRACKGLALAWIAAIPRALIPGISSRVGWTPGASPPVLRGGARGGGQRAHRARAHRARDASRVAGKDARGPCCAARERERAPARPRCVPQCHVPRRRGRGRRRGDCAGRRRGKGPAHGKHEHLRARGGGLPRGRVVPAQFCRQRGAAARRGVGWSEPEQRRALRFCAAVFYGQPCVACRPHADVQARSATKEPAGDSAGLFSDFGAARRASRLWLRAVLAPPGVSRANNCALYMHPCNHTSIHA